MTKIMLKEMVEKGEKVVRIDIDLAEKCIDVKTAGVYNQMFIFICFEVCQ